MKPSGIQYKSGRLCIFLGMAIAGFALFLHPKDPKEFLQLALFNPWETFQLIYGSAQTIAFWIGMALTGIGLAAMLNSLFHPVRTILHALRMKKRRSMTLDNEDNWIFL